MEKIYFRHKGTAEVMNLYNFEKEHIEPKAKEYYADDEILADFIMSPDNTFKNYLPDWEALKKAFWEYCYDLSMKVALLEWEELEA